MKSGNTKGVKQDDVEMELNYNDRPDGYGFGPPEHMDDKQPYENERKKYPEVSHDQYGQRNQYGPVDQYNFRDIYQRRWAKPNTEDDYDDWREWDKERYSNDDYSRFAGSGYRDKAASNYHGVSGKTARGGTWPNRDKYEFQRNFVGKGPKGYRRSDDRIYEEVCETLMRHEDIDASEIGVRVNEGLVTLEGKVEDRQTKRMAENVIENLLGVEEVVNRLRLTKKVDLRSGAVGARERDLGVEP